MWGEFGVKSHKDSPQNTNKNENYKTADTQEASIFNGLPLLKENANGKEFNW